MMGQSAHLIPHVAVAGKDKFGMRIKTEHIRHGPDQNVRSLLYHHAADEKDSRIERADGIAALDFTGINGVIEGACVDAIVDNGSLVVGALIKPSDLVLELVGHRDDPIGTIGAMPFVVVNARREAAEKAVAVATIFRRVHGQHAFSTSAFLDPDQSVGSQPIVGVDDIKSADVIFHSEKLVDKRAAHVVDFVHKIGIQGEIAAVIMHAINTVVACLVLAATSEDMDFMATAV